VTAGWSSYLWHGSRRRARVGAGQDEPPSWQGRGGAQAVRAARTRGRGRGPAARPGRQRQRWLAGCQACFVWGLGTSRGMKASERPADARRSVSLAGVAVLAVFLGWTGGRRHVFRISAVPGSRLRLRGHTIASGTRGWSGQRIVRTCRDGSLRYSRSPATTPVSDGRPGGTFAVAEGSEEEGRSMRRLRTDSDTISKTQ